jgi:hypothetical protein
MSGKQQAVLWLGLTLVVVRMFATGQWSLLWKTAANPYFTGSGVAGDVGSLIGKGALLAQQTLTPGSNSSQTPGNPSGGGHALTPVSLSV